ncbi:MAG: sigma 54-interacting transcriptional regulator [Sandaracinaceae bacterium]
MGTDDDQTTASINTFEVARQAGGPSAALIVHREDEVEVIPLRDAREVVFGRSAPSDVVIDDPGLSRQHASFQRVPEGVRVVDLRSTNGTYRGGEAIREALLAPGEAVTLGGVTVSVSLATANAPLLQGIESYERFFSLVEDELLRSLTFGRPLALLMVQGLRGPGVRREETMVSHWVPRVREGLRAVDRIALYGEAAALILLPETDAARALGVSQGLVSGERLGEPTPVVGAALTGRRTGELVDRARALCRRASRSTPVVLDDDKAPTATDRPVFQSPAMVALRALVERVARSTMPVLVQGETGSGKEVIARSLHLASDRAGGPMRSLNCGAIAPTLLESQLFGYERGAFTGAERTTAGLFEQASGGTLFLDEVGELSQAAQAALLRVLETGRVTRVGATNELEVDVRLLTATHRDLEQMVEAGSFRQDLWFRLNTMQLSVPPLRDRPEDLEALVERFFDEANRASGGHLRGIEASARAALRAHRWPGNVRELRNVIERAVVVCLGETIGLDDLPEALRVVPEPEAEPGLAPLPSLGPDVAFKERVKAYEKQLILDALVRTNGNQTQAAKLLRMPLRTLVHKLTSFGIKKRFQE